MEIKNFELPKDGNFTEEEVKGLQALGDYIKSQFQAMADGIKSVDQIVAEVKDEMTKTGVSAEKMQKLETALKEQGTALATMQKGNGHSRNEVIAKIKAFIEDADSVSRVKSRGTASLEIKADAAAILFSGSGAGARLLSTEIVPEVQGAPVEASAVYPKLLKGSTSSNLIKWVDRKPKNGGSAFVAEGALKPLKDWEYVEAESSAKKIAVRCKVSSEMLSDFAYMRSEISKLLSDDLLNSIDEKLLTGTGGAEPTGIATNAATYTATSLDGTVVSPNHADAIRAGILQLRNLAYTPDVVFLNPADKAALDLAKDNNGRYLADELQAVLGGIAIVETTHIPAGKFLLMDSSKWNVRNLESFRLEYGWENDDFSKNLVTVIAEIRLHSYQSSVDVGSLVYGTFATIEAALMKP